MKALFPRFSLFLHNLPHKDCIFIFLRYSCSDRKHITGDNSTCRGIRNKKSTKDSEVLAQVIAHQSPEAKSFRISSIRNTTYKIEHGLLRF